MQDLRTKYGVGQDNIDKKQQELERRMRSQLEEEERKRIEEIQAKAQAIKELSLSKAKESPVSETVIETEPESVFDKKKLRQMTAGNHSASFSKELEEDIKNTYNYKRGQGLTDEQIQKGYRTMDDISAMDKIAKIEPKIKEGKEKGLYKVQEGYLERQAQDILSKEANKEMAGLPNQRAEVDQWIMNHPELQQTQDEDAGLFIKFMEGGPRGVGSLYRTFVNTSVDALKDPMTYLNAAIIMGASAAIAPATGGGSMVGGTALAAAYTKSATLKGSTKAVGVAVPATAKWLAKVTPMTALKFGMTAGRTKSMADLEGGLAYNEYINEGMNPEIAKAMAQTVGAFNGLLESAQIETLTKVIPGVAQLAKEGGKEAAEGLMKKLLKIGVDYGTDLAGNITEEMLQESNTYLGLELGKYLQESPNPNTLGGLDALAKTMGTADYRARVAESGMEAAMSMWLFPIGTQVGGYTVTRGVNQLEQSAANKRAKGWYTNEESMTNAAMEEYKKVLLSDNGAIDRMAGEARNNSDKKSYQGLLVMKPLIEDILARPDITNEERSKFIDKLNIINEVIAENEFAAKETQNDIEIVGTDLNEIRESVLSGELDRHILDKDIYVERYREAEKLGIPEMVREMKSEGKTISEITEAIQKKLPKKQRNAVEATVIRKSVEIVDQEAKTHRNLRLVKNYEATKHTLVENEATEQTQTGETEVVDTNGQTEEQSPSMETVEPQSEVQAEVPVEEVENQQYETPKEDIGLVDGKYKPSDIVKVPVAEINIDPKRFQFRYDGTTDKLAGTEWNDDMAGIVLLWENEHGDLYVVNGHHRVALAQDNNVSDLNAKILRGVSEQEARAQGALLNIAEGSASSVDVAKYMRDTNSTLEQMTELGIPPKSKIARDGEALSKLDDGLFKLAATRQIPIERAVMIGREFGDNKPAQRSFLKSLMEIEAKGKTLTNNVIQEMITQEKGMVQESFTEQTLLGEVEDTKSLRVERAEVVAYVKDQLGKKKSLLKNVSQKKNAEVLESAGNKIDTEKSMAEMTLAEQALFLLDKTLNQVGTMTNKMFNDFARQYAKGDEITVKREALNRFIQAMESGEILEEAFGKRTASEQATDALMQEEIPGQADMLGNLSQLKAMPNIKVVAKQGTNKATRDLLMPLIQIMEKNPIFNGMQIIFNGQESTKYMDRSELNAKGYFNYEPGHYTTYGWFESNARKNTNRGSETDNAKRSIQGDSTRDSVRDNEYSSETSYTRGNITLTNSAKVDTLLHESIHAVQDILERVDPEFSVLLKEWEDEIFELARNQGVNLPSGKEMLTHALMLGEFGYADDDYTLARMVAVPPEITTQFRAMLGKEFVDEAKGDKRADPNRKIKADFKKLANGNLKDAETAESVARAKQRRLTKIKMQLRDNQAVTYYSPDTTTYAIAVPKDTQYEVSIFNESGLLAQAEMTVDKLASKLSEMGLYFNPQEVSYQLKQFDRTQVDEVYKGEMVKIFKALQNARVGNFTAKDFDTTLKGKLNQREADGILTAILSAATKGFDKPNSKITFTEYRNRFYSNRDPNELRVRERNDEVEIYYRNFKGYEPRTPDATVPEVVVGRYDTAEEAIADKRNTQLHQGSVYVTEAELQVEYEDFKNNYETYREDFTEEFDGQIKFNVSYQVKEAADITTENFKKWFKDSKVVDEEGNPLVVYHGTNAVFDNFNPNLKGYYFTDNNDHEFIQYTNNTIETYLSIQNPYYAKNRYEAESAAYTGFTQTLKQQGYDGLIYEGGQDVDYPGENPKQVIAFNPTQIKSVYNNGQFSEYNPDINYQLKESADGIEQYSLGNINNFVEAEENKSLVYSDTVDLHNNKVLSVDGEVTDRLLPFIKYDAVMGGYDAIKLNNEDPILITNDEILEVMERGQPLFQIKTEGDLLAVHNLSVEQLKGSMKLQGLPMASIAVTKTDYEHTRYGDVSILFNSSTIDPRVDRNNRVYSGDAYTPSFPRIALKISETVADRIETKISNFLNSKEGYREAFRPSLDYDNLQDQINRHGSFVKAYQNKTALKLAYLNDNNIDFEVPMKATKYTWENEVMDVLVKAFGSRLEDGYMSVEDYRMIEPSIRELMNDKIREVNEYIAQMPEGFYKEEIGYGNLDRLLQETRRYKAEGNKMVVDIYATRDKLDETIDQNNYIKWLEQISEGIIEREGMRNNKDTFTPSGNRRSWESLHYDVTMDNILKAMKGEDETASGMFGGIGRFGAAASRVYSSIDDIRSDMDRLTTMDEEVYQTMRDEYNERLTDLASRIADPRESNQFIAIDRAFEAMVDAIQSSRLPSKVKSALKEYGSLRITDEAVSDLISLAQEVAQMPTEYFEAKPRRGIGFEEWAGVVLPNDVDNELVTALQQNGIHFIEFYDRNVEGDRQRAVNEILGKNDVSFQVKKTDTDTEAFKNWFSESKVVDENGNPLVVYHGTPNYGFTEFRSGLTYFSTNEDIADIYQSNSASMLRPGSEGNSPGTYAVYLDVKKPFDTRIPENRAIYMSEYQGKYGNGTPLSNRGLIDWVEGEDVYDFLQEKGYDFDGIIFDEGGLGGYGNEVTDRGISYVTFSPNQIKSVYNSGAWSAETTDIYYQIKDEQNRDYDQLSWTETVANSELTSPELKAILTSREYIYEVAHNEDTILAAAKLIEDKGEMYIRDKLSKPGVDVDHNVMAAGGILHYHYMERGDAVTAEQIVADMGTKAKNMGQGIQILAMLSKQSPTGMVRLARREFESRLTDKQRAVVDTATKDLANKAKDINTKAIDRIDVESSVNKVKSLTQDEINKRKAATSDTSTRDYIQGEFEGIPKTEIDSQVIIDTIKQHYKGEGQRSLFDSLVEKGLNEVEADLLATTVKQQMKEFTSEELQEAIDQTVTGKAEAVDTQMKDLIAEGRYGEALRKMVGQKKNIPVLTSDLVNMIYERGKEIQALPPGRQKDVETHKLWRDVSEQLPVAKGNKISTFHTMMMLLNFKTMARNLIGNDMFRRLDTFVLNTLGSSMDKVYSEMNQTQRTTLLRLKEAHKQQRLGYKEGFMTGLEDALLGIDTSEFSNKYELKQTRSFKRDTTLGKLETVLNIGLRATDRAAVMASYFDSISEQMEIAGVTEATQEMHERALTLGLYRTFNDTTRFSETFTGLKKVLNKIGLKDGSFGLGDLVLKFPRTPANILARALDYSPAGAVMTVFKVAAEADPYLKQRMMVEGYARALAGTSVIGIGAVLASLGVLTGSEPDEDKDLYELQEQSGLREFSINMSAFIRNVSGERNASDLRPGDTLLSYDWAQPLSIPLAVGADAVYGSGEALDFLSTTVRAAEAGVTTLTEQPLLTGVANLFRYGDPVQGFTSALKGLPASFSPSLFSQVAQAMDGGATNPYSFYPVGRQAWNMVANKLPGNLEIGGLPLGRGAIPDRIGVMGEEERWFGDDNFALRLAKSTLSPMIISEYVPSEEAQFLMDLYEATGNPDVIPNSPQRQYTVYNRNDEKVVVKPTAEQFVEWSRWLGENTKKDIADAMRYGSNWSAEDLADEIKYLINERRKELKDRIEDEIY